MQSISILVLALAFSCTLALDVTLDHQWKLWKETNNKRYVDAEEHVRYEVFVFISTFDFSLIYEIVVVLSGKVI
jgi:elongation factor P hydroxylase